MTDSGATCKNSSETFLVRTPHGVCEVTLMRCGLALGDRGGFDARWTDQATKQLTKQLTKQMTDSDDAEVDVLSLEAFRAAVKEHLLAVYLGAHGQPPGHVTLNLSSHQLVDDLIGWTKLNWRA